MLEAQLLHSIFRDATDLVVILQPNRGVKSANPAFMKLVAGAEEGVDFMDLVAPEAQDEVLGRLVRAAGGDEVLVEVNHRRRGIDPIVVEYRFFPLDGGMVAGLGRQRSRPVSSEEALGRAKAELREKARILDEIQLELTQVPFIDPVTGVWNRMQVIERLTGEWSRSERYGAPICCLMVDVEGLDSVRENEGAFLADEMLKTLARRLKAVVRDHDIVGRFAGDRFVVVGVQADSDGARALSRRILEVVSGDPIRVEGQTVPARIRIGGATNRSEGVEILEDLFSVAESALLDARDQDAAVKVAEEMHV